MRITIFGSGYVGLVTGACLADAGNQVLCVDIDERKIAMLERGDLRLRPESEGPLGRLPGLLRHLAKELPVTVEEMKEAVREGAVDRFERSLKK